MTDEILKILPKDWGSMLFGFSVMIFFIGYLLRQLNGKEKLIAEKDKTIEEISKNGIEIAVLSNEVIKQSADTNKETNQKLQEVIMRQVANKCKFDK